MSQNYNVFFDLSPACFCIADYKGNFVDINPAFIKLLGYSKKVLLAKPILDFVHPSDRERTIKARNNLKLGMPLIGFENRYLDASGNMVWLHWTSINLDGEGRIYAVANDITLRKAVESERDNYLNTLDETNKGLKELNYTTAHNLRSPVANLIQLVELLDDKELKKSDRDRVLYLIKVSAIGLNTSLENYVDAIKEKEAGSRNLIPIIFADVLEAVKKSIDEMLKSSGATINCDFTPFEGLIYAKGYMESIFLNLITNSIKYSRNNVPAIITISSGKNGDKAYLEFRDNGLGFDLKNIGHLVFGLNETFHGRDDAKGIGLYLVKSHVNEMGGTITLQSRLDQGSTFRIEFSRTFI